MYKILILNLGDTSTKISIFEDEKLVLQKNLQHDDTDLAAADTIGKQIELRKRCMHAWMEQDEIDLSGINAAVVRTTQFQDLRKSGTYIINDKLRARVYDELPLDSTKYHGSWMTLPVLFDVLGDREIPIFLVDPATVDELEDVARVTGIPGIERFSAFHALNQKAVARLAAAELGKSYKESNYVVVHMGGGVSVGAHRHGRVIDTTGGQATEGPFSPNRCGSIYGSALVNLCYSGEYTKAEMFALLTKKAGFVGHLGVGDMITVEKMIEDGDEKARLIHDAFIYQIGQSVASMAAVLHMDVDAIVLTGGIAHSKRVVKGITEMVGKIAPVMVYPGEKETEAMVAGALRVLRGEEVALQYGIDC